MIRHYASGRSVQAATALSILAGALAYVSIPEDAFAVAGTVARNLWVVLGPIGAFCIQLLLQLLVLGEDKALKAREQMRLSVIADERVRFLWDLTTVAVVALLISLVAGSLPPTSSYISLFIATSVGFVVWTGLLAVRLPSLYSEIRAFRWRLARERAQAEARARELDVLKPLDADPDVPEVFHREE